MMSACQQSSPLEPQQAQAYGTPAAAWTLPGLQPVTSAADLCVVCKAQ
jgi:hypothetical protein